MIFILLSVSLILRLLMFSFGTLALDQNTFIAWSSLLARDGFFHFYNGWSDYLPGYLYILYFLGKVRGLIPDVILYKLPAILADTATGYLIYNILRKIKGVKWGLIGAGIYIFNPAILANSTLWGQVDSLTALTSIASVYFLPIAYPLSAIILAIGTLIKPQTAFIFPVIVFLFIKNRRKITDFLIYCFTGLFVFVAGFVPFWNHGTLFPFIYERLGISANQYPYTSINAFNFWGVIGFWKPDNLYFQIGGYILVLAFVVFLFYKLWKVKNPEYYLLSFIFGASFILFTRMHERHLLPIFAPLVIAAIGNPIFLIPYLVLSLTYVANLYYSYFWISNNFTQVFPDFFLKLFSVLNIAAVVFIFYSLIRNLSWDWSKVILSVRRFVSNKSGKTVETEFPKINLPKKSTKIILGLIITFAFFTRVFELGNPPNEYFDEVYHAFTAKVMMHADANKAWEWWNSPPAGFAYEWTHPPLAKLGMVAGMKIFGENSFGWRIPGAVLGTLSVYLIYLIAKELFKDEAVGLLSSAVYSLDGLSLVMSRIGMNDTYFLFFALLAIYMFMQNKSFFSAVAFGLSLASKWSAIWAIPILFILWLKRNPLKEPPLKVVKTVLYFLVFPISIYLLTYLPMFLTGHNLSIWWEMQKQMWWYHTGLKATHPYTSMWWSWPFLIRPVYLYTSDEVGGWVARIYAMGNPLVFWFGLSSIITGFVYAFIEKNKRIGFIVFSYLIFFVPWAASPRIMFFYHYLPSIPFLAIATAYVLRRNQKLILPFLILSFSLFVYFYPHWAGLQVPLWLDKSYYWIGSWR